MSDFSRLFYLVGIEVPEDALPVFGWDVLKGY